MRDSEIDITDSILKERLIRRDWIVDGLFNFFYSALLAFAFPVATGIYLLEKFESKSNLIEPVVLFSISMVFATYIIRAFQLQDKLTRVSGTLRTENSDNIKTIANSLGWKLERHTENVSILVAPWNLSSANWGREIVVIYDGNDMLINCMTYGLSDIKSPIHRFRNTRITRDFIELLNEKRKQRHANHA